MSFLGPGFAEVIFKYRAESGYREALTSLGFAIAGFNPATGPVAITLAWGATLTALGSPSTAAATGCEVRVGTADPSAPLVYTDNTAVPGSGGADLSAPNVSLLVTKATALGGRKGRGRMFIPMIPEQYTDDVGNVDATYLGNAQTEIDNFKAAVEGIIGGDAYLLHEEASPAPTLITAMTVDSRVATQRRRMSR